MSLKCTRKDCFAYTEEQKNNCDALTTVSKKACPFYKTKEQNEKELKEIRERKKERERKEF